jgi:hypothetical protein
VTWLENRNGVRLAHPATLVSAGILKKPERNGEDPCSLELWLQPENASQLRTLAAFYSPQHGEQFSVLQNHTGLTLRIYDRQHPDSSSDVYFEPSFHSAVPAFLTIASGPEGTSAYLDGKLLETYPQFRILASHLTGQLVLGTSAIENSSWAGELRGLAIYHRDLAPAEVLEHYRNWTEKGRPNFNGNHIASLYLFDERGGNTVHDQGAAGVNLSIPERYLILHEKFLEPPWTELRRTWSYGNTISWNYWKNVLINIAGFIPLGIYVYALLQYRMAGPRGSATVTIIFGTLVSLTIEVLQAYLPTRDSGLTDVITNTLGTAIGVVLYRWRTGPLRRNAKLLGLCPMPVSTATRVAHPLLRAVLRGVSTPGARASRESG